MVDALRLPGPLRHLGECASGGVGVDTFAESCGNPHETQGPGRSAETGLLQPLGLLERSPGLKPGIGKGEGRGEHAHDRMGRSAKGDGPPQDLGIPPEAPVPQPLAQEDGVEPTVAVLVGREGPAEQGLHAQHPQGVA